MWTSLSLNLSGPTSKLSAYGDGFLKPRQLLRGLEPRSVETSLYTNELLFSKLSLHGTHPRISLHPQPKVCVCVCLPPEAETSKFPSPFAKQEACRPSRLTLVATLLITRTSGLRCLQAVLK